MNFSKASCLLLMGSVFYSSIVHQAKEPVQTSSPLGIEFTKFSPAFAAMEDEFLFVEFDRKKPLLKAGSSNKIFITALKNQHEPTQQTKKPIPEIKNPPINIPKITIGLGEIELRPLATPGKLPSQKGNQFLNNLPRLEKDKSPSEHSPSSSQLASTFKVSYGPMVIASNLINRASSRPFSTKTSPQSYTKSSENTAATKDFTPHPPIDPHAPIYNLSGPVELTQGLALLGELKVSWIVDGEEKEKGYFDLDSAKFDLAVQDLTGHVVISLFDNNQLLMGEGIADLDALAQEEDFNLSNIAIDILPMNPSLAGRIRSAYSLGGMDTPIAGAFVSLYGFDVTAESTEKGEFHFNQWQQAESRTIALASKEGYWDSVFLIDSKMQNNVLLFPDRYMDSFLERLFEMDYTEDIRSNGIIFGLIESKKSDVSGLNVEIQNQRTIYFQSHMAMADQTQTDSSGLFTIVNLEDGDYVLSVKRENKIIDRRILVVEGGKVSPITINLDSINQIFEFHDPLFGGVPPEVGLRYFDKDEYSIVDHEKPKITKTSKGNDPLLIDYIAGPGTEANVFMARTFHRQGIPIINENWLEKLRQKISLDSENGVAFGFIETQDDFRVVLAEVPDINVYYFDKTGKISQNPDFIPSGFIISELPQGLYTVLIVSPDKKDLYLTDLIYNNHESFSILQKKL